MDLWQCDGCGKSAEPSQKFCNQCGSKVSPQPQSEPSPKSLPAIDTKKCRFCAETIKSEALICRYCNREQQEKPSSPVRVAKESQQDQLMRAVYADDFTNAISLLPSQYQAAYQSEVDRRKKNTGIAYLYRWLLGMFGAHRFYLGDTTGGSVYVISFVAAVLMQILVVGSVMAGKEQWGNVLVWLVLYAIAMIILVGGFILDLFLIPGQVTRANDQIRKDILIEIANRLPRTDEHDGRDRSLATIPYADNFSSKTDGNYNSAIGIGVGVSVVAILVGISLTVLKPMFFKDGQQRTSSGSSSSSSTSSNPETGTNNDASVDNKTSNSDTEAADMIEQVLKAEADGETDKSERIRQSLALLPKPLSGDKVRAKQLNKSGLSYLKQHKYEEAAADFESASTGDPSDPKLLSNLGFAELNLGSLETAQKHLNASIAIDPTRAVAWGDLGLVLAKKGKTDDAVSALLTGYRVSNGATIGFLQALLTDKDSDFRDAGKLALTKVNANLLDSGTVADSSAGSLPVAGESWASDQSGYGEVRPSVISNGGDASGVVEQIHWRNWGGVQATGDGVGFHVPEGAFSSDGHKAPAIVVLGNLGMCHGKRAYRSIQWYFPNAGQSFDQSKFTDICENK